MSDAPQDALADIARRLRDLGIPFALVGGLAVSIRSEVRFTRDLDIAVAVQNDERLEALARDLRAVGYHTVATVEQEATKRLSIIRLQSPADIAVDLIAATCGIEAEIVARASSVEFPGVGTVPVACAEDLLAMKVLSVTDERLQDRLDAVSLILTNPDMDIAGVRTALHEITQRGYHRGQDLAAKLGAIMAAADFPAT